MSIRTKTTLFIIVTIGAIVGLIEVVHSRTALDRFRQIEEAQIEADVGRVVLQLDNTAIDLSGINEDWGWWGDTYDFLQDGNSDYIDDNLYAEAMAAVRIDLIAYLDLDGASVYNSWYRGDDEFPVPDGILERAQPGGLLGDFPDINQTNVGFIVVDGTPFLVSATAGLTSLGEGPSHGVLVMGKEISGEFVSDFAALTNLDVTIAACEPGSCTTESAETTLNKTSEQIFGSTVVNGLDGQPAITIAVTESRDVFAEGAAGVRRVQLITLSVGALAALLSIVLARRILVRRLERLNDAVTAVGQSRDHSIRVSTEGSDEIASLSMGINQMLNGLEAAQDEVEAARSKVEAASEAKSRFLSRVSHEVRNPLNGVIAYAQLLEMDDLSDEQSDGVEQILSAGRHITSLLEEFLDIARIEAGAIPLHPEPTAIGDIAQEALDLSRPSASERSITIQQSGDRDMMALVDPLRFRQVLLNLISNAIKYGDENGVVTIHQEAAGEHQVMTVTDNGPGISHDKLERLFIPFDRLNADEGSIGGTGVGLTVTKQLVELMGGSIRVDSQVGSGTRFTIEVPSAIRQQASLEAQATASR